MYRSYDRYARSERHFGEAGIAQGRGVMMQKLSDKQASYRLIAGMKAVHGDRDED